jgi:uncharacterized protein YjgD (DUF1641 family)
VLFYETVLLREYIEKNFKENKEVAFKLERLLSEKIVSDTIEHSIMFYGDSTSLDSPFFTRDVQPLMEYMVNPKFSTEKGVDRINKSILKSTSEFKLIFHSEIKK